jgi:hypothetical protein
MLALRSMWKRVPRRGYRFIAPVVASPQTEAQGPIVSVSSDPAPALAQPTYHRSRSRIVLLTALTTVIVLAATGIPASYFCDRCRAGEKLAAVHRSTILDFDNRVPASAF